MPNQSSRSPNPIIPTQPVEPQVPPTTYFEVTDDENGGNTILTVVVPGVTPHDRPKRYYRPFREYWFLASPPSVINDFVKGNHDLTFQVIADTPAGIEQQLDTNEANLDLQLKSRSLLIEPDWVPRSKNSIPNTYDDHLVFADTEANEGEDLWLAIRFALKGGKYSMNSIVWFKKENATPTAFPPIVGLSFKRTFRRKSPADIPPDYVLFDELNC